ncbi:MAG: hypothetical protein LBH64_01455, partial [Coriobacteriales bacterium]|nr:hypothetical protein [Coriobacteriales bacterium]
MWRRIGDFVPNMPSVLGFAAHWTWIWCVFWSMLFYGESSRVDGLAGSFFSLEPLWTISLLANVLTLALLLALSYAHNPLGSIRTVRWIAGGVTSLGTLLVTHPLLLMVGSAAAPVHLVGAILTGVGSAAVVVLWGELFTSIGARQTISC